MYRTYKESNQLYICDIYTTSLKYNALYSLAVVFMYHTQFSIVKPEHIQESLKIQDHLAVRVAQANHMNKTDAGRHMMRE